MASRITQSNQGLSWAWRIIALAVGISFFPIMFWIVDISSDYSGFNKLMLNIISRIPAVAVAILVARKADRLWIGWGIAVFFLPFLVAILGVADYLSRFHDRLRVPTKFCGNCGKPVDDFSKSGECCPYCGVIWDNEKTTPIRPVPKTNWPAPPRKG